MADHFISFSTPMVRSLLDDRKTNTRRELSAKNLQIWTGGLDHAGCYIKPDDDTFAAALNNPRNFRVFGRKISWTTDPAPHQQGAVFAQWQGRLRIGVGDRLWVKEAWRTFASLDAAKPSEVWSPHQNRGVGVAYVAGGGLAISKGGTDYYLDHQHRDPDAFGKVRNSRFMPKWASRITLLVTDVRIERLGDITDADAIAEGATSRPECKGEALDLLGWSMDWSKADNGEALNCDIALGAASAAYRNFYHKLNRFPDRYGDEPDLWPNPWVVVYKFTVVKDNIERIAA